MIEWISQNKEWLFSGIGVSAFAVLVWIVRVALKRIPSETVIKLPSEPPQQAEPTPASQAPDESKTNGSPFDLSGIIEEVCSRPPYQQKESKRYYLGLKIEVVGTLFSADAQADMISFTVNPTDKTTKPEIVFCKVLESECPELKIAHQGWHIRIEGILADFDRYTAKMEQVKVLTLRKEANNTSENIRRPADGSSKSSI